VSQDTCMQTTLLRNGGCGYAHISRNVERRFMEAGLTVNDIVKIRVDNPQRMLARAA
jgi:GntR family transcriptional regulator